MPWLFTSAKQYVSLHYDTVENVSAHFIKAMAVFEKYPENASKSVFSEIEHWVASCLSRPTLENPAI